MCYRREDTTSIIDAPSGYGESIDNRLCENVILSLTNYIVVFLSFQISPANVAVFLWPRIKN